MRGRCNDPTPAASAFAGVPSWTRPPSTRTTTTTASAAAAGYAAGTSVARTASGFTFPPPDRAAFKPADGGHPHPIASVLRPPQPNPTTRRGTTTSAHRSSRSSASSSASASTLSFPYEQRFSCTCHVRGGRSPRPLSPQARGYKHAKPQRVRVNGGGGERGPTEHPRQRAGLRLSEAASSAGHVPTLGPASSAGTPAATAPTTTPARTGQEHA